MFAQTARVFLARTTGLTCRVSTMCMSTTTKTATTTSMVGTSTSRSLCRTTSLFPFNRTTVHDPMTTRSISTTTKCSADTGSEHTPSNPDNPRILITGACGQIGTELSSMLRNRYGHWNVVATDIFRPSAALSVAGPFYYANVTDFSVLEKLIVEHHIDWIVHNSGILSARGEQNPELAFDVNIMGLKNIMELARIHKLRVFAPSSIAAFGPTTPLDLTPDITIQRPTTMYGVSKVFLELLGEYYHVKYGVDFRSLRYPGVISSEAMPGGGTTDYAVDIFYQALNTGKFDCYLRDDSYMPMMYMPDCLDATIDFLSCPNSKLKQRTYNVTAMSFAPKDIVQSVKRHVPELTVTYSPDFRQRIADSWPKQLDDTNARRDWGWDPKYDLDTMVDDMITRLRAKMSKSKSK